ncbi:C2H2-type domain-containing protein [Caenorhabditis elegans]|uniref:C2H2-type domain-containing protein n=1 Tax=Caenorhabditis elegans TaxID=6239 RepID=Q19902_CAEEL|nr:C2H2-type domain-containing protein [Caenorhabditis elegans]CAB00096.1 C2H2-type domain-containing protein [Caenorhabditis elegans]|eukprot:NP_001021503.1 Zinc finger putative Transcription Factor family [Caenorhabditis elegans]
MSHINLYSLPTDHKNMIRCRYCEKIYKIDNGSSGFIRHLRCKHPNVLYQMGAISNGKEYNLITKQETLSIDTNNEINLRDDDDFMMMKEFSSNQILVNFLSQLDLPTNDVNRVLGKRHRISPTPTINSSVTPNEEHEPDLKMFNSGDTLQNFLIDIDNHIRQKNQESQEAIGTGEESTSASALDMPSSQKESREPSPNSSMLDETNGGTETGDSSPTPFNPARPFGCVICPCSFPRVKDLTIHVTSVHRTRFRCNTCLAEFVQPQHLEHHYSISHAGTSTGTVVNT